MKPLLFITALMGLAYSDICELTLERPGVADLPLGSWKLNIKPDGTIDGQVYYISDFKRNYVLNLYGKPVQGYDFGYEITWVVPLRKVGVTPVGSLKVVWEWGFAKELYPVVRAVEGPKIWKLNVDCQKGL